MRMSPKVQERPGGHTKPFLGFLTVIRVRDSSFMDPFLGTIFLKSGISFNSIQLLSIALLPALPYCPAERPSRVPDTLASLTEFHSEFLRAVSLVFTQWGHCCLHRMTSVGSL